MIPKQLVENIIKKTDIAELISEYVDLTSNGAQLKGVCPFCHSSSFTAAPTKQIWKCFKCNKGGDAVKFIVELQKVNFPEAIRFLANRLNIEIPQA
ncbi:CHC2 zinc finger domain-containing protein [Sphingobacterium siyangense]|uniref:CHC2 zinc finger domain-containing protein n=1 Tax=Sphingobacterium siyangense TaxID=459529 RepID=UPI003DA409D8